MREVVLVHGLWHGAWAWQAVRERLDARGVASRAVELPMRTLQGDAETVRSVLDAASGEVLLVGHSYGGAVVTAAGEHPAVTRLLYLAAFALTEDESIARVAPDLALPDTELPAAMRFSADGDEVSVDPQYARALLYPDAPAEVARDALARLRPVGRALFRGRPAAVAWRARPATYVVCAEDRTVAPALQRVMAARCDDVREWPGGHSPAASRPDEVAELVAELAAAP